MLQVLERKHNFVHVHGIGIPIVRLREVVSISIPGAIAVFFDVKQSRSVLNFNGYDMRWSIQNKGELSKWSQFNIMLIGNHQIEAFCICLATLTYPGSYLSTSRSRHLPFMQRFQHTISFTSNTRGHVSQPVQERRLLKPLVKHWHSFSLVSIRGASDKAHKQVAQAKLTATPWSHIEEFHIAMENICKVVSQHLTARQYKSAWNSFEVGKVMHCGGWYQFINQSAEPRSHIWSAHKLRILDARIRLSIAGAKAALGQQISILSDYRAALPATQSTITIPAYGVQEACSSFYDASCYYNISMATTAEVKADLYYHEYVAYVLLEEDHEARARWLLRRAASFAPDDVRIRRAVQYAALEYYPATLAVVMEDFLMTPALTSLEQYQIWKEERRLADQEAAEEEKAR